MLLCVLALQLLYAVTKIWNYFFLVQTVCDKIDQHHIHPSQQKRHMVSEGSSAASHRSVEILASKLRRRLVTFTPHKLSVVLKVLLKFRQIVGSRATALETLLVLRQVISKARFSNFEQLVEIIRDVGRRLVDAQPKGLWITFESHKVLPIDLKEKNQKSKNIPLGILFEKSYIIYEKNIKRRPMELLSTTSQRLSRSRAS